MIHTAVQLALMILFWGARAYIWGGTLQITSCFLLHFFLFLGCTKTLLKLMYFEKATIINLSFVYSTWYVQKRLEILSNCFYILRRPQEFDEIFIFFYSTWYVQKRLKILSNCSYIEDHKNLTKSSFFFDTMSSEISTDVFGLLRIYELWDTRT